MKLVIKPSIPSAYINGKQEKDLTPSNIEDAMVASFLLDKDEIEPVVAPSFLDSTDLFMYDSKRGTYSPIRNGEKVKTGNFFHQFAQRYLYAVFKSPFKLRPIVIETDEIDVVEDLRLKRQYEFIITLKVIDPLALLKNRNNIVHYLSNDFLRKLAFKYTVPMSQKVPMHVVSVKVRTELSNSLKKFGVQCCFVSVEVDHPGGHEVIEKSNETVSAIKNAKNKTAVKTAEVEGEQKIDTMKRAHQRSESENDFRISQERNRLQNILDAQKRLFESDLRIEEETLRETRAVALRLYEYREKLATMCEILEGPLPRKEKDKLLDWANVGIQNIDNLKKVINRLENNHIRRKNQRQQLG